MIRVENIYGSIYYLIEMSIIELLSFRGMHMVLKCEVVAIGLLVILISSLPLGVVNGQGVIDETIARKDLVIDLEKG